MTLKQQKVDVTDRVIGKMKNGEMELFLDNTSIGKIQLPGDMTFQLDQRFEVEQRKIFQNVTVTEQPDAKYTDCDDGGWCQGNHKQTPIIKKTIVVQLTYSHIIKFVEYVNIKQITLFRIGDE